MAYSSQVLADGPVAYYRMDESSGQPQDSSGNANHTTVTGGTPIYGVAGAIRSDTDSTAITLESASSERFTAPDHNTLDVGDVFTLECWVKRASTGALMTMIEKGSGGFQLDITAADLLNLSRQDVQEIVNSTVSITDTTTWHHCVATKNGATVKLYLDRADVTGTVTNSTIPNNASTLNLGSSYVPNQFFNGSLDEIAIYPTALSEAQVFAHYDAAVGGGSLRRQFLSWLS